jgi:hypothetical protein
LINVAVEPTWRRKGIARSLVQACLDEARRLGAVEVVLQVDADNRGAQELYESLGFLRTTTRTTWSGRIGSTNETVDASAARPWHPEDSPSELALARRLCPDGLVWPRPLDGLEFRLSAPWGRTAHWVWPKDGAIRGFLVTFPGYESPGVHALLVIEPEVSGHRRAMERSRSRRSTRPARRRCDSGDSTESADWRGWSPVSPCR